MKKMFSLAILIAVGVAPALARAYEQPLNDACDRFGIDTPARLAGFLGQVVVETGALVHVEENLYYTMPERVRQIFPSSVPSLADAATLVKRPQALANRVYANRLGNGDEASGDGWAFRGRGLIQLTGRTNYTAAGELLARPYVDQPELVAAPADACLTAAWFWDTHQLNTAADAGQIDLITRTVNGKAMLHADLRRQRTQEALAALT